MSKRSCSLCSADISRNSMTGLCRICARRNRGIVTPRVPGDCNDCGTRLGPRNQSGYCARCCTTRMNNDPTFQTARTAGIKRKWQDPEYFAKMQKLGQRLGQKSALDEELQERRRQHGKWTYATFLSRPDIVAKCKASVKANGPKLRAIRMAWCPPELWDRHKFLVRSKRLPFAEAQAIVFREWDDIRAARHPWFPEVIDFMRRHTAIFDQGADKEKRYRVGLTDMTAGELLRRAEFNGYQYPRYPQANYASGSLDDESPSGKIAA